MYMAKMIQIRHVPDALHKRLRARAAHAGMTLSDYLRAELEEIAEMPTLDEYRLELRELHRKIGPIKTDMTGAEMIREIRGPLPGDDRR